jgi:hypothetical protein
VANVLQTGAAWLAGVANSHAGQAITYRRGDTAVDLTASVGKTEFALVEVSGAGVTHESRDYLVSAEDLELGGVQVTPLAGDQIEETDATGVTRTYEVMAPGGEPCWRWSDSSYIRRRIHTKLIDNG